MLIDTHCHLTDPAFDADRAAVIDRMLAAGVLGAVVIESDVDRLAATRAWAATQPTIRLAAGCHPHDADRWDPALAAVLDAAWHDGVAAVGEIGLDYHYDHAPRQVQRAAFAAQLGRAVDVGLPAVIHAREADEDVVAVLREQPGAVVVLHSFSSGPVLRDAGLADGWYFSFSGMVTFRSWAQTEVVRAVPAERLLVETDSPYLAPVPHRGHRNEPAFVAATAARVAELRGTTVDAIAAATSANARRLFWNDPASTSTP
ncbi:MAG: TatD family hydrolase [Gemmatimonadales bacterium]